MSRHQSGQALQRRGYRSDEEEKDVVEGCEIDSPVVKAMAAFYRWLDNRLHLHGELAGSCETCGRCCDFDSFDHRLFVTPPELMYLTARLGRKNIRPMQTGRCPYNVTGRCEIYEHRFAGCRIFCCRGDSDFQSELSESALKRLKTLCTELQIPYRYTDLATGLNGLAGA
jgi:hypothetical protein